jgi:ribonuclease HI
MSDLTPNGQLKRPNYLPKPHWQEIKSEIKANLKNRRVTVRDAWEENKKKYVIANNSTPRMRDYTIYRREAQKTTVFCWTDGSEKDGKAGFGVFWKTHSIQNVSKRTLYYQNNYAAELEAIKTAMKKCPVQWDLIIWSDCQAATKSVTNFTKTKKMAWKVPYRHMLEDIKTLMQQRSQRGANTTLEYVPSHIEEKKTKYASDPQKMAQLNRTMEEINHKYPGMIEDIIAGNEAADQLAKQASEKEVRNKKYPSYEDSYSLWSEKMEPIEANIRKQIRERTRNSILNKWHKQTRKKKI